MNDEEVFDDPGEDTGFPGPTPTGRGRGARSRPPLRVALLAGLVAAVAVVGFDRSAPAESSPLRVTGGTAPAGVGWAPSFTDDAGRPARWDPCAPIHLVVDGRLAPPSGRADLDGALDRLRAASGLRIVVDGETDETPRAGRPAYDRHRYGDRWAPLLVAWATPADTDVALGGREEGLALITAVPGRDGGSIVSGQVVLNTALALPPGFGPGVTQGEVFLHELGHAVGLAHVDEPAQIMYPTTNAGRAEWGAGDRAGLAALRAPAGCHPAPAARPLRLSPTTSR